MIGAFIAAYFYAKKPIMQSLIFWIVLLVIGWVLAAFAMGANSLTGTLTNLVIGILIFIGFAVMYLKVDLKTAGIMYIISLVINIAIGYVSGVGYGLANTLAQMI